LQEPPQFIEFSALPAVGYDDGVEHLKAGKEKVSDYGY
jgi:hypothetical protein